MFAGRDQPFVNNYGVWTDEFKDLSLDHTLDAYWDDAVCHFGEKREVRVGRRYALLSEDGLSQLRARQDHTSNTQLPYLTAQGPLRGKLSIITYGLLLPLDWRGTTPHLK